MNNSNENFVQQVQSRIDSLTGAEDIKELLTIKAATEMNTKLFNTAKLDEFLDKNDDKITADTTNTDLVAHARGQNRYPFIEEIIRKAGGVVNEYPYDFLTGIKECNKGFIGEWGSTWHVRPTTVGCMEDGKDVVYSGVVYESAEDKSASHLYTQKGLSVIGIKRISIEEDALGVSDEPYMEWQERAVNGKKYSYLCDEHHQPFVFVNKQNGQKIFGWGSRNSVIPTHARYEQCIRYGKTLDTLSTVETVTFPSVPNYMQLVGTGNYVYAFSRVNVNQWWFSRGGGGQNFKPHDKAYFDAGSKVQYYLEHTWVDTDETGKDAIGINRGRMHVFGQGHPTLNPDNKLYYLMGTMVLAGDQDAEFTGAGMYLTRPTTGEKAKGDGRLGKMDTLDRTNMELAYTCPAGRSYRILDVQYGRTPRALIAEFVYNWEHGETVPLGTTWDLRIVEFNEWTKSWSVNTIKTGIRGAMGFKPWQNANKGGTPIEPYRHGVESYTSFYTYGACFYRGKNGNDNVPKVYLTHRIGGDLTQHRLTEIHLNDRYSSVLKEVDLTPLLLPNSLVDWNNVVDGVPAYKNGIKGSRNFIYRPDTILNGNKRGLVVGIGLGWSMYESWSSEGAVVLRPEMDAKPKVDTIASVVNIPTGKQGVVGLTAHSPNGSAMTYAWEYKNAGGSWQPASADDFQFEVYGAAVANNRLYRCNITNSVGTTVSPQITIKVV